MDGHDSARTKLLSLSARWLREAHVIATSLVGVQLLVWTFTGFAFTLFDFEHVRGTKDRAAAQALDLGAVALTPAQAVSRAAAGGATSAGAGSAVPAISSMPASAVSLRMLDGRAVYEVTRGDATTVLDANSGELVTIDAAKAARIATAAHRGAVHALRVTASPVGETPAFVVRLSDAAHTEVTVDSATGHVESFRNEQYRAFDALWSAHVLGYLDRTSPANWPLRIAGFFALIAAVSGASLLVRRVVRWFARRFARWGVRRSKARVGVTQSGGFSGAVAVVHAARPASSGES